MTYGLALTLAAVAIIGWLHGNWRGFKTGYEAARMDEKQRQLREEWAADTIRKMDGV